MTSDLYCPGCGERWRVVPDADPCLVVIYETHRLPCSYVDSERAMAAQVKPDDYIFTATPNGGVTHE